MDQRADRGSFGSSQSSPSSDNKRSETGRTSKTPPTFGINEEDLSSKKNSFSGPGSETATTWLKRNPRDLGSDQKIELIGLAPRGRKKAPQTKREMNAVHQRKLEAERIASEYFQNIRMDDPNPPGVVKKFSEPAEEPSEQLSVICESVTESVTEIEEGASDPSCKPEQIRCMIDQLTGLQQMNQTKTKLDRWNTAFQLLENVVLSPSFCIDKNELTGGSNNTSQRSETAPAASQKGDYATSSSALHSQDSSPSATSSSVSSSSALASSTSARASYVSSPCRSEANSSSGKRSTTAQSDVLHEKRDPESSSKGDSAKAVEHSKTKFEKPTTSTMLCFDDIPVGPSTNSHNVSEMLASIPNSQETVDLGLMHRCSVCGRKFQKIESLEKHAKCCRFPSKFGTRKVGPVSAPGIRAPTTADAKRNWRAESNHLRNSIRLVPSENSFGSSAILDPQQLFPCNSCGRTFTANSLETHQGVCSSVFGRTRPKDASFRKEKYDPRKLYGGKPPKLQFSFSPKKTEENKRSLRVLDFRDDRAMQKTLKSSMFSTESRAYLSVMRKSVGVKAADEPCVDYRRERWDASDISQRSNSSNLRVSQVFSNHIESVFDAARPHASTVLVEPSETFDDIMESKLKAKNNSRGARESIRRRVLAPDHAPGLAERLQQQEIAHHSLEGTRQSELEDYQYHHFKHDATGHRDDS